MACFFHTFCGYFRFTQAEQQHSSKISILLHIDLVVSKIFCCLKMKLDFLKTIASGMSQTIVLANTSKCSKQIPFEATDNQAKPRIVYPHFLAILKW